MPTMTIVSEPPMNWGYKLSSFAYWSSSISKTSFARCSLLTRSHFYIWPSSCILPPPPIVSFFMLMHMLLSKPTSMHIMEYVLTFFCHRLWLVWFFMVISLLFSGTWGERRLIGRDAMMIESGLLMFLATNWNVCPLQRERWISSQIW